MTTRRGFLRQVAQLAAGIAAAPLVAALPETLPDVSATLTLCQGTGTGVYTFPAAGEALAGFGSTVVRLASEASI